MAKTNNLPSNQIIWLVTAALIGAIVGYLFGGNRTFTPAYLTETGSMMKTNGSMMMQMMGQN
jgi:uncharacterized protein YneF (UPF0154 family)